VQALDPDQPLGRVITLQQLLDNSVGSQRFSLALVGAFAVVALLLASLGLYGLVAYTVTQRTEEIGVRLALGASPGEVLRLVVRQAMGLATLGILIGLVAAMGAGRFIRSLLYEVSPLDPLTFILVPVLLLSAIALASLIPARRAARVDPVIAIRGAG